MWKIQVKMLPNPPEKIIARLKYDRQTVFVRRLHFFDDKPVRYEVRYLRGDMCGGIFWEELEKASIHELLVFKYDLPLTKVRQRITAEAISPELFEILGVEPGHPVFHIERTTYTFENPVTSVEYIILGEVAFEDTFEPHEALSNK
ncbi:MAG: UTRA domain-containing protein [Pseudomonadota bacterium]|nr:UTRA domain-containing protein [Pseudomonadota bacterium]